MSYGFPIGLRFKLLHVGVAVSSIGPATETLQNLFGYKVVSGPFDDPTQKVTVNFMTVSDDDPAQIELITPLTSDSPVRSILEKGGGGAYHLCFETNDFERALAHVKECGCVIISQPVPAVAFGGRRIVWLYTSTRLLIELVEQAVTVETGEVRNG